MLCLSHQPCSQPVTKTRHETELIMLANGSQEIINSFMEVTSLGTIKSGRKEPSGASDITAPARLGCSHVRWCSRGSLGADLPDSLIPTFVPTPSVLKDTRVTSTATGQPVSGEFRTRSWSRRCKFCTDLQHSGFDRGKVEEHKRNPERVRVT